MAKASGGRRVMSLSMVKNEQDIVEPFIRHHARLVDCMVVVDNASVDSTRRVAVACARELGNVVVLDSATFAHTQSEQMTRLLHRSQAAFGADFVLLLDTDEFVGVADRAALLVELERIPPSGIGYLPWRTFVLGPDETKGAGDPPGSFRWRRREERPLFCKAVLRLDRSEAAGLRVEQGNHDVAGFENGRPGGVRLDGAPLLHFPVRSPDQLATKGVVGWMANLAADPSARDGRTAFQWRDVFDRVIASGSRLDLCDASVRYAQDRPDIDWSRDVVEETPSWIYVRRYSDGCFEPCLSMVARSWERSLAPVRPGSEDGGWRRFLLDRYGPGRLLEVDGGKADDGLSDVLPAEAAVVTTDDHVGGWLRSGWEIDEIGLLGLRCAEDADGSKVVLRRSTVVRAGSALPRRPWWRTLIVGS